MIDKGVSKGSHFVECQLLGEEGKPSPPFKILCVPGLLRLFVLRPATDVSSLSPLRLSSGIFTT